MAHRFAQDIKKSDAAPPPPEGAARPPPTPEAAMHDPALAIEINDLRFDYPSKSTLDKPKTVLHGLNMALAPGSRCLLIGANGAGKSTLLRVLGGKHMCHPDEAVRVLGKDTFRDLSLNLQRTVLDTEWGMRTVAFAGYGVPLQADIRVGSMMANNQKQYPERAAELTTLLGINPDWRMHQVSDGQRRRVQLFLGLLKPFEILLLDEVTTALDVIVRQDLLMYLAKETEERGATIVYATHIFDGLDEWPTHMHYLHHTGVTGWQGPLHENEHYKELRSQGHPAPLLKVVEKWLRKEVAEKAAANAALEQAAGSAAIEAAVTDAESGSFNQGSGYNSGRMMSHFA